MGLCICNLPAGSAIVSSPSLFETRVSIRRKVETDLPVVATGRNRRSHVPAAARCRRTLHRSRDTTSSKPPAGNWERGCASARDRSPADNCSDWTRASCRAELSPKRLQIQSQAGRARLPCNCNLNFSRLPGDVAPCNRPVIATGPDVWLGAGSNTMGMPFSAIRADL